MARASGVTLKQKEAAEEEEKKGEIYFCCLAPGPGSKNDQRHRPILAWEYCRMVTVERR